MKPFTAIGLMSGTSMDGIDAALMQTDGRDLIERRAYIHLPYPPEFRLSLKEAELAVKQSEGTLDVDSCLRDIIEASTDYHIRAVTALVAASEHSLADIDIIGYHGQTVFHRPDAQRTIQLGDPVRLATKTQTPVVSNFRANDIRHGGQGAPIAPIYHQALVKAHHTFPSTVINCGGIANVTCLTGPALTDLIAYDAGPGNALIDAWVRRHHPNAFMDRDGEYGLRGRKNDAVIEELFSRAIPKHSKNYFKSPPPKSLDSNDFQFVDALDTLSFEDACATLEAFSAYVIVKSFENLTLDIDSHDFILSGGGWRNPVTLDAFKKYLGHAPRVHLAEEFGWNSKAIEAEMMAYYAARHLLDLPITTPLSTGVDKPRTGGVLYEPQP